jgi:sugar phosphate isomerase/epimerase
MPQFGICVPVEESAAAKAAGWDFVEENIQNFLKGLVGDGQWDGPARLSKAALPVPAANSMVPASLKITGDAVDFEKLQQYMAAVTRRAKVAGMKILVFGSAGARNVPEGFDREKAEDQIVRFLKMAGTLAEGNGITIVIEPLNKGESNIINTVPEAVHYLKRVKHPAVRALVDSFHHWLDGEPLEDVRKNITHIAHVHLADKDGRVPPGESGTSDYRTFFRMLKDARYEGMISVEALNFTTTGPVIQRSREFLRRQWEQA